jgi:hypothetical protein
MILCAAERHTRGVWATRARMRVAHGVDGGVDPNGRAVGPVPVREDVNHGHLGGVPRLIPVEAVLGVSGAGGAHCCTEPYVMAAHTDSNTNTHTHTLSYAPRKVHYPEVRVHVRPRVAAQRCMMMTRTNTASHARRNSSSSSSARQLDTHGVGSPPEMNARVRMPCPSGSPTPPQPLSALWPCPKHDTCPAAGAATHRRTRSERVNACTTVSE